MATPLDSFLNPDGTLNLGAIYSSGMAGDASQAAAGGGQYRDYGNVTGPSMYTTLNDPGSTPAYWGEPGKSPWQTGGGQNPVPLAVQAQLGVGGAGGAAAGFTPGGRGTLDSSGYATGAGAPAGYSDPYHTGGAVPGSAHTPTPWASGGLGPEYYDPAKVPFAGDWAWNNGRWQLGGEGTTNYAPGELYVNPTPNAQFAGGTTPVSGGGSAGGPLQPNGPGGVYPAGYDSQPLPLSGAALVNAPAGYVAPEPLFGTGMAQVGATPQLGPAALVNAPAPGNLTTSWVNPAGGPGVPPAPAAIIKRLTGSKIAAPTAPSLKTTTQSSGLINYR